MTALNIHTQYSILKATCRIEELIKHAKKLGFTALAITDYGNIYGAIEFYKKCVEYDIKPLIGVEILTENASVVLICKDDIGYKNLVKIITVGTIKRSVLKKHHKGLIMIGKNLDNRYGQVDFCKILFKEDFYNSESLEMDNICYITEEDKEPYEILLKIGENTYPDGTFLKVKETPIEDLIAQKCNFDFTFGEYKLPKFGVDNPSAYLRKLCEVAFLKKDLYKNIENVTKRLDYELSIIEQMGFSDYFLVVWDFVRFAKENGIAVGPGRGSAAGSLVSYLLDITTIDPIKNGLFFERFLNPERITMPDIDIDFCIDRRGEVIDYCTKKYGKDRVANIITFGTLSARAVIRDVGRVLGISYNKVDSLAKMIPRELNITLDKSLEINPTLRRVISQDKVYKNLFDVAKKIEGLPRHISTHAAGIIISDLPLTEYIPLTFSEEATLTGFSMQELEELGLLKIDFLGLRNLTIIKRTIREIPNFEFDYEDKETFKVIATGETTGMFQLESPGMRKFMAELKPKNLNDIAAGLSLYRPGPMDFIPRYLKAKNGGKVTYTHELLKPILEETYGCIVYQEQVMQILVELAGFSLSESDNVRRAISKMQANVISEKKEKFILGCIKNDIPEKIADTVFNEIAGFAKYAFNKSHAAAYAVLAFQTAYLKMHFKREFFANLMTLNTWKIKEYKEDCNKNGIKLLHPCVNRGKVQFIVYDGDIIFGLSAIKNVGYKAAEEIVREAPFTSFNDFLARTSLNKKALESIIFAGALDIFKMTRKHMNNYSDQITLFGIDEKEEYDEQTKKAGEVEVLGVNL
ncbi:MAG: DNA polymerase III subunit alpha [Defluviitaleaceae bacterium]|nr:DNA polymerase III subunit alpha [Defluviitaleaceae bacterium]